MTGNILSASCPSSTWNPKLNLRHIPSVFSSRTNLVKGRWRHEQVYVVTGRVEPSNPPRVFRLVLVGANAEDVVEELAIPRSIPPWRVQFSILTKHLAPSVATSPKRSNVPSRRVHNGPM
jgi:hypothetical protein